MGRGCAGTARLEIGRGAIYNERMKTVSGNFFLGADTLQANEFCSIQLGKACFEHRLHQTQIQLSAQWKDLLLRVVSKKKRKRTQNPTAYILS